MKYQVKEEYSHLVEENQIIYDVKEDDSSITIYVKTRAGEAVCPVCGSKSRKVVSTYVRVLQDTPIRGKTVWLRITVNKYECENPDCNKKVFSEELTLAGKNQVRTYSLDLMILAVSVELSAKGAERTLRHIGVKVSHDTIRNLVNSVSFKDDPDVEAIGIDDVAIRKGRTYGTIIYNLETGEPLCLLAGRKEEDVIDWLKAHPKIRTVARDRASAYASAVSKALPEAHQTADRFHLFENIIDVLEELLKDKLPTEVYLSGEELTDYAKKESTFRKATKAEIAEMDYDSSPPLDSNGEKIRFKDGRSEKSTKASKKEKRLKEKIKKIKRVREYFNNTDGATINSTAEKFHITFYLAKKYISMSEEEIADFKVSKHPKKGEFKKIKNIIYKMYCDGWKPSVIFNYIKDQKIYNGHDSSLRSLIYNFGRRNFPLLFEKEAKIKQHNNTNYKRLNRTKLFNLLLQQNPSSENEAIRKQLIEKFEECRRVYEIFDDFHHAIMDGKVALLDSFLEKYNKELPNFCRGIKKDRAAVNQAISSEINSGIVEGNNTKFKLVKRIVYGRSILVNLEKKFLLYCRYESGNYNFESCG